MVLAHQGRSESDDIGSIGDGAKTLELTLVAIETCLGQKALDVRGLHLAPLTDFTDFVVICTSTSERHAIGIMEKLKEALKERSEVPLSVSGQENGEWIVMDYGSYVIHILNEEPRNYYKLDELWDKAPEIKLCESLEKQAKALRTGLYL